MSWSELKTKLDELRARRWSWSVGHMHGNFCATLWKDKPGTPKFSNNARQGRYVVSELGSSPEDALTRAFSRHERANFESESPSSS